MSGNSEYTDVGPALHTAITAAINEAGDVDVPLAITTFLRALPRHVRLPLNSERPSLKGGAVNLFHLDSIANALDAFSKGGPNRG